MASLLGEGVMGVWFMWLLYMIIIIIIIHHHASSSSVEVATRAET